MTLPIKFDPAQQRDVCLGLAAYHEERMATAKDDEDRRDHERAAASCREHAAAWESWRLNPARHVAIAAAAKTEKAKKR